jgi:hypothetical protein
LRTAVASFLRQDNLGFSHSFAGLSKSKRRRRRRAQRVTSSSKSLGLLAPKKKTSFQNFCFKKHKRRFRPILDGELFQQKGDQESKWKSNQDGSLKFSENKSKLELW